MKPESLRLNMDIGIDITLWQAIKLRIAGKHLRKYLEAMVKEAIDKLGDNGEAKQDCLNPNKPNPDIRGPKPVVLSEGGW